jgi:transcriptional regulator with XRE-family HTH domain
MLYAGGMTPTHAAAITERPPHLEPESLADLTVGERMGIARKRARVSTTDMGEQLGVHRNTVNNYEAGRTPVNKPTMFMWAAITGSSYEWLTGAKFAELTPFNRMLAEFPDIFIEANKPLPDDLERFSVPVNTKEGWLDSPTEDQYRAFLAHGDLISALLHKRIVAEKDVDGNWTGRYLRNEPELEEDATPNGEGTVTSIVNRRYRNANPHLGRSGTPQTQKTNGTDNRRTCANGTEDAR